MHRLDEAASRPQSTGPGPISVLCVDDDADYLDLAEAVLTTETDFDVRTETSPLAAPDRLDGVDCVVSDDEMPRRDGLDLLAAVRDRRPTLPFVLCTGRDLDAVLDRLVDDEWTEVVRKDGADTTMSLLATRVQRLVARHRTATLADRATTALDEADDGIAVVTADGEFAVVNRSYAREFGYDREALVGRNWRTCYPDEEADRLVSTALEPVRDDWRWTGRCLGRRADGETFTAPTCIVGLDDGSFVVRISDSAEN